VIVVDTHVWLWLLAAPERLSQAAAAAIEEADVIGVSAMSCWEIGMLETRGRIRLSEPPLEWIRAALAQERTAGLPVEAEIATAAALLPPDELHGDPADRIIYATARAHDARLITKDGALRAYDPRGTLW
jgi:PIN domain nuclease of toxin-antitoxin system